MLLITSHVAHTSKDVPSIHVIAEHPKWEQLRYMEKEREWHFPQTGSIVLGKRILPATNRTMVVL